MQSAFLVVGVMIGVAMVVAVDLANGSARRAFELGAESVAGRTTHQIAGGPSGLDESLYVRLRRDLGYRLSAPAVEEYVTVEELDAQPMRLLAVDPFAEGPFRSYLGVSADTGPAPAYLSELMVRPNSVLMSAVVAERYGLAPGDSLQARSGGERFALDIVGLLEPNDDLSRRALDSLLIADIATGQELLGKIGKLDRIDLIVAEGEEGAADLARIEAILPPGARIVPAAARQGAVSQMTAAFHLNLTALSLLALVVGMFLIYNTVTFSVVQRRAVLGSLAALGMTRAEIFSLILLEAMALGLIGTAAGLGLGVLLGRGAVQLVTQTINDLFFVVSVREIGVNAGTLVKGAVAGAAAAALGAVVPAYEATSVPPAGALRRSNVEERARAALPWISGAGLVLIAAGALLLIPDGHLSVSFAGLFGIVLGGALLTPLLTLGIMAVMQRILTSRAGVIGRMAPRYVVRALSRTSVAIAALMVAVSVIIGVGVMTGSFRMTVGLWLDDVLQADIYVSPPSLNATQTLAALSPEMVEELAAFPGVERMAFSREVEAAMFVEGEAGDAGDEVGLVAFSDDLVGEKRRYREAVGDWRATWQAVEQGGVLITEPLARRYSLGVGDAVTLQTDRGRVQFPVAGVAVDYDVRPTIFMHEPVFRYWWDDDKISAAGLFVQEGADVGEVAAEIRVALAGRAELVVRSNRGMRQDALEVFDRTFAITVALQLLAAIVAFIGILSTLMSLQLERMREIGVLRATGMTRGQLWRLSLVETGLIGGSAGLLALPMGLVLALVLIYIINLRSFGWSLEMRLDPWEFVQAFGVALGAALLAGVYPAWRMARTQPANAVRAE